jgi:hypothetical protein
LFTGRNESKERVVIVLVLVVVVVLDCNGLIRSFVSPVTIGVLPHLRRPSNTLFEDEDDDEDDYDLDATRSLASGFWLLAPLPDEQELIPTDLSAAHEGRD